MIDFFLILDRGAGPNTIYPLMDESTIGRSPDNTISLFDKTVSRNHAKITSQEGVWLLEDLNSVNGIIFNGECVDKVVLASGNTFKIGRFTFRFIEREIPEARDHFFETISILSDSIGVQGLPAENLKAESWWGRKLQDAINEIPFFFHLKETERKKMVDGGTLHIFNAGEMIIRKGDEGRSIYVILEGRVQSYIEGHNSEELELAVLGASQFFGERSFFAEKPGEILVVALEKSLIIEFNYINMKKLIQKHPPTETVILNYYKDRLAESREIIARNRRQGTSAS